VETGIREDSSGLDVYGLSNGLGLLRTKFANFP